MSSPVTRIAGTVVALLQADIDTDQIMPKQYLKRVERSGFGQYVFHDWRAAGGSVLDDARFSGASILVAGRNFGCGSSREQAVWGLLDHGFAAVVAPSFGPIFRQNSARSRLLAVEATPSDCERLAALATAEPSTQAVIDIERQQVTMGDVTLEFELDRRTREVFVLGTDEIERTAQLAGAISAYEERRSPWLPTTQGLSGGPGSPARGVTLTLRRRGGDDDVLA